MDTDGRYTIFGSNGTHHTPGGPVLINQRAGRIGCHRIEQSHRYVEPLCREDTLRVEDFSAEIGKLSSFIKAETCDGFGALHDPWVVVVHTINIRPYLYFVGTDGRPDERCGIV